MALCTAALLVSVPAFPLAKGVEEAKEAKDQSCSCANTKYMSATNLQHCMTQGDPHYTVMHPVPGMLNEADFKNYDIPVNVSLFAAKADIAGFETRKFDFMGTGVYTLVKTPGACACSGHDDVEIQTFMVGTKLFRNAGASSNGAVAVKLQVDGKFLVFTISAEDGKLVKSEPDNPGREIVMNPTETAQTKCFPCDVDNCACGGSLKVKVQRVKRNYGRKRYWIWRIEFPGGGHMEAMRIMDSALPLGAWLFLYTALPEGINPKKFEGLCSATPCDTLYIEPCGEFETGVQYGGNVIASHPAATGAWDCSHKCWDVGRFQDRAGPVFFSYDAGANPPTCKCLDSKTAPSVAVDAKGSYAVKNAAYVDAASEAEAAVLSRSNFVRSLSEADSATGKRLMIPPSSYYPDDMMSKVEAYWQKHGAKKAPKANHSAPVPQARTDRCSFAPGWDVGDETTKKAYAEWGAGTCVCGPQGSSNFCYMHPSPDTKTNRDKGQHMKIKVQDKLTFCNQKDPRCAACPTPINYISQCTCPEECEAGGMQAKDTEAGGMHVHTMSVETSAFCANDACTAGCPDLLALVHGSCTCPKECKDKFSKFSVGTANYREQLWMQCARSDNMCAACDECHGYDANCPADCTDVFQCGFMHQDPLLTPDATGRCEACEMCHGCPKWCETQEDKFGMSPAAICENVDKYPWPAQKCAGCHSCKPPAPPAPPPAPLDLALPSASSEITAGRACKKPCGVAESCLHVKATDSLFPRALRKRLQRKNDIPESVRPNSNTQCETHADPPIRCPDLQAGKWPKMSWYRIMSRKFEKMVDDKVESTASPEKCRDWCNAAALLPLGYSFGNPWKATSNVCQLKKSLLDGAKIRCGLDEQTRMCNLFVGGTKLAMEEADDKFYASEECSVHVQNVTECPEDPVEETGCDLAGARQACQACKLKELTPAFGEGATWGGHNHIEGNIDDSLFQSCVTDWCATGGHLPDYHADECELIKECEVLGNCPPGAPPPPAPTSSPTDTDSPTSSPTRSPTSSPTRSPTSSPTRSPTSSPAHAPTSSPTASSTVTVGNDPAVKMDGGMIKFSLTPGKLSNMLSWNADANMQTDALNHKSEHVNLELKGITFTPEDRVDLANAQWFSQLTLMANKVPVLNVSRGDDGFGAMLVEIDGKRQHWEDKLLKADGSFYSKTAFRTFYSKKSMLTATIREGKAHVDDKHAQVLNVEAPGFEFSIETRPALKFVQDKDAQVAYGHLNLKFDKAALPPSSKGFLAQLAGLQRMTDKREDAFRVTDLRRRAHGGAALHP